MKTACPMLMAYVRTCGSVRSVWRSEAEITGKKYGKLPEEIKAHKAGLHAVE
jgi:hypothetical protein